MLILTRRFGERLFIGERGEIIITVLSHNGQQVKLGVTAPKDVPVDREEIFERKQPEKAAS